MCVDGAMTRFEDPYMYQYMKILNTYNEDTEDKRPITKKVQRFALRDALKKATKDFVSLRYHEDKAATVPPNDDLFTVLQNFLNGVGRIIDDTDTKNRFFLYPPSNKVGLDLLLRSEQVVDVFGTDGDDEEGDNTFLKPLIEKAKKEQGGAADDAGLAWLYFKGVLSETQMFKICTDILDIRTRKHVSLLSDLPIFVPPTQSDCRMLDDQIARFALLHKGDNTDDNTTAEIPLENKAARMDIRPDKMKQLGEALTKIQKHGEENWVWFLTLYFYHVQCTKPEMQLVDISLKVPVDRRRSAIAWEMATLMMNDLDNEPDFVSQIPPDFRF